MELNAILPTVRVTEAEKAELEKEAFEADRSLSAHLRFLIRSRKGKKSSRQATK